MRLATVRFDNRQIVGVVDAEQALIWPIAADSDGRAMDMLEIIQRSHDNRELLRPEGDPIALSDVEICAPIPRPARNIFCVGKNYHAHAHEFTRSGFDSSAQNASDAIPTEPIIFSKVPESVIAHGDTIHYPVGVSESVDYEAELALVIGKGGKGISAADAYDHIWGYTIINDMTARDLQGRHKQWLIGKSLDTFCPMGPWLVTADEVDPENLRLQCWVNDELRQDANTSDLIFNIPKLIETLSAGITLQAGDIIATGTPAGVGIGFDPPRYLYPGDRIDIEIAGLGRLSSVIG